MLTGDDVTDKFCLGTGDVPALCAENLDFCTITGGNTSYYFLYLNGIVGFAPPPNAEKTRSFINQNNTAIYNQLVSWNFNIPPMKSTVMIGGNDSDNYTGGALEF